MKYFVGIVMILPTLTWGYSIFSITGVGEPIFRGELFSNIYSTPFALGWELSWESMEVKKVREGGEFGLEYLEINLPVFLPLFKTRLEKLFDINFRMKSEKKEWGETEVEARGGIILWENSFYQKIEIETENDKGIVAIKGGKYKIIGEVVEEWKKMFVEGKDIMDTVKEEFSGGGYTVGGGVDLGEIVIYTEYYSPTKLNPQLSFPSRIEVRGEFNLTQKIKVGGEFFHYGWWRDEFQPMNKIEIGGRREVKNWELRITKGWEKWYYRLYDYGEIRKNFITFSIGVRLKKGGIHLLLTTEVSEKRASSLVERGVKFSLNCNSIEW